MVLSQVPLGWGGTQRIPIKVNDVARSVKGEVAPWEEGDHL